RNRHIFFKKTLESRIGQVAGDQGVEYNFPHCSMSGMVMKPPADKAVSPFPSRRSPRRQRTVMPNSNALDATPIHTIRPLSMDAVQGANPGPPGTPMALAPVAYCLWQHFLRFDPQDPIWPNRDRFVLSAGHASMLLYSLLHLTGVKAVSKD